VFVDSRSRVHPAEDDSLYLPTRNPRTSSGIARQRRGGNASRPSRRVRAAAGGRFGQPGGGFKNHGRDVGKMGLTQSFQTPPVRSFPFAVSQQLRDHGMQSWVSRANNAREICRRRSRKKWHKREPSSLSEVFTDVANLSRWLLTFQIDFPTPSVLDVAVNLQADPKFRLTPVFKWHVVVSLRQLVLLNLAIAVLGFSLGPLSLTRPVRRRCLQLTTVFRRRRRSYGIAMPVRQFQAEVDQIAVRLCGRRHESLRASVSTRSGRS